MTTWQRANDVVAWSFRIPAKDDASVASTMRRAVGEALRALPPFARATGVSVTTASAGEDAVVARGPTVAEEAADAVERIADALSFDFSLELLCVDADESQLPIPDGADLRIDLDEDDGRVYLYLALHVDIYAWRSWAMDRDNAVLAERNAPLLARFLSELKSRLGVQLQRIDNNGYDVDGTGFRRP